MRMVFHRHSVHSSLATSGSSGMRTRGGPAGCSRGRARRTAGHCVRRWSRPGCGRSGGALGVGHQLATAVATPAPVVERAGDLVALDGALRQVAAHVPAVAVEHLQVPVRVGEHDQLGAERLDRVRLAVPEVLDRAEAVPAAGVPVGRAPASISRTPAVSVARRLQVSRLLTRTRYSFSSWIAQRTRTSRLGISRCGYPPCGICKRCRCFPSKAERRGSIPPRSSPRPPP